MFALCSSLVVIVKLRFNSFDTLCLLPPFFFFALNEEAAAKHIQDFKQLKAEKKVLEKELKKVQVTFLNGFLVLLVFSPLILKRGLFLGSGHRLFRFHCVIAQHLSLIHFSRISPYCCVCECVRE